MNVVGMLRMQCIIVILELSFSRVDFWAVWSRYITKGDSFLNVFLLKQLCKKWSVNLLSPTLGGHFGIVWSVRLSVQWQSCLGYRCAACLQLSHHRPPEMCGLRTHLQTDIDPPHSLDQTLDRRGAYRLASTGAIFCLCKSTFLLGVEWLWFPVQAGLSDQSKGDTEKTSAWYASRRFLHAVFLWVWSCWRIGQLLMESFG